MTSTLIPALSGNVKSPANVAPSRARTMLPLSFPLGARLGSGPFRSLNFGGFFSQLSLHAQ
jgi:hypothetical protein